jgi:hypothetical protein
VSFIELGTGLALMAVGLFVILSMERNEGEKPKNLDFRVGVGFLFGVIGLTLLALWLNGYQYF